MHNLETKVLLYYLACVDRPTVAGIHGNESVGCYSIALSGGYEDDIDLGESFTYTGSGWFFMISCCNLSVSPIQ